tara:strand:+ start:6439 stop:7491 length:1053 start_codon:yes stop_codon:yes gene_type:complete
LSSKPRILIIRFSSLGDIVIQTSFVRWLKHIKPDYHISFLVAKEFAPLVNNLSEVDQVWTYERTSGLKDVKQLLSTAKKISHNSIDLVFDLHGNTRTAILSFISRAPFIKVDKRSIRRKVLVKFKKNYLKNLSSQHRRTIEDFQFLSNSCFDFKDLERKKGTLSPDTLTKINELPIKNEKIIIISPVASFESKRWPIELYQNLIDLILEDQELSDFKIVILAGPSDHYCQALSGDSGRVKNLQGKLNLVETFEYFSKASLCVTNDTGSLHMAESYGIPCLAIFGSTSPDFGFRPHLEKSRLFYSEASCSPCSTTGKRPCHREQHQCMLDIKPASVYSILKEKLLGDLLSI